MYKISLGFIFALLISLNPFTTKNAAAEFNFSLSFTDSSLNSFHLSVGDYYGASHADLTYMSRSGISDDEMPVALFISTSGAISINTIINLRLKGLSWFDISLRYKVGPDRYYVPFKRDPGPPYGKAWGYYKNKPKKKWKNIKLRDSDMINLVNVKFMSKHYGIAPGEVAKQRGNGKKFKDINSNIRKNKGLGKPGKKVRGKVKNKGTKNKTRDKQNKQKNKNGNGKNKNGQGKGKNR